MNDSLPPRTLYELLRLVCIVACVFIVAFFGTFVAIFNGFFGYTPEWRPWIRSHNINMPIASLQFTPLEFLEFLTNPGPGEMEEFPQWYAMDSVDGWIKKEDVRYLAMRLNSKVPCMEEVSIISSYRATKPITEGQEAFNMICGYKENHYPTREGMSSSEMKAFLDKEKIAYPPIESWTVK